VHTVPATQAETHVPLLQAGLVDGQALPQAPQLFGSLLALTQAAPQSTNGAAHVPASSGWKPTPTAAIPFGCSVRSTLAMVCATSVTCCGSLIHVACVADVTELHATGYARPVNASVPNGRPSSAAVSIWFCVTSKRCTTMRAPATSISTQATFAGTPLIAATARPALSAGELELLPEPHAATSVAAAAAAKEIV
jgi:hypothetical protein